LQDWTADEMIRRGLIRKVSLDPPIVYYNGWKEFTGLALLTNDLPPRDPGAEILSWTRRVVV